jgi:hypothetical protein
VINKALGGQITITSRLIAHKLPRKDIKRTNEEVAIPEQGVVILKKGEVTEAIRISDSKGQSISADTHEDGSVDFSIGGRSRQGEAGVIGVCQTLISRLNQAGASWGNPTDVSTAPGWRVDDVDCIACDGSKFLKIQVTRAERDQKLWKELNTLNEVSKSTTCEELANALKAAIQAKANKISSHQRKELILALDATDLPSHAFQPVIDSFRNRHGNWAVGLGFKGIWVVGPNVTLTSRLDEQAPS